MLKDKIWLWTQVTSLHQRSVTNALRWNLPDENTMDSIEGAFSGNYEYAQGGGNMNSPSAYDQLHDDWRRVIERSFGKRRQAGYYIWNYGEGKPLTADEIRRGCEIYAELFYKDMIDEIIFCSTRCIDLIPAKPAVSWLRNWIMNEKSLAVERY